MKRGKAWGQAWSATWTMAHTKAVLDKQCGKRLMGGRCIRKKGHEVNECWVVLPATTDARSSASEGPLTK